MHQCVNLSGESLEHAPGQATVSVHQASSRCICIVSPARLPRQEDGAFQAIGDVGTPLNKLLKRKNEVLRYMVDSVSRENEELRAELKRARQEHGAAKE